jgi:hypothetical protein
METELTLQDVVNSMSSNDQHIQTLVKQFTSTLLPAYLDHNQQETISSTVLTELWCFFMEGISIRRVVEKFGANVELEDLFRVLDEEVSNKLDVADVYSIPFIYQMYLYQAIIKEKFKRMSQHLPLYIDSDDPIVWWRNNSFSTHLSPVSPLPEKFVEIRSLLKQRMDADPIAR